MMQLVHRASLVVVLLLASVGTASAECAWVLWSLNTEDYQKMLQKPIVEGKGRIPNFVFRTNWERLAAFDTQGQCVAVLKARAERRWERRKSTEDMARPGRHLLAGRREPVAGFLGERLT
jgi:hypothetical protein